MLQLTFNPGLTLTDFRTTRPLVVAAGPWSEEEEEFIIIPETVGTRCSRVAGSVSIVALY